jgi:hypothetical protein
MKLIKPSPDKDHNWPRHAVKSVECRKRDLVLRITDWTRDRDEPAYDVEVYIGGVYDWNQSQTFSTRNAGQTKREARTAAVTFAHTKIAELL